MDMITAIFAANKAKDDLTKSRQIGYAETSPGYLVFDGDPSGKFCIPASDLFEGMDNNLYYVRLSTTPIKGTQIILIATPKGEVGASLCNIIDENGCVMVTSSAVYTGIRDDFVLVLSLPAESGLGGVYVFGGADDYISGVYGNLVETVHTIDPKYLPPSSGGGLPVVELTTLATEEGAVLTAEEVAKIEALHGEPCLMRFGINLGAVVTFTAPMIVMDTGEGVWGYVCALPFATINVDNENDDGIWRIQASPLA